MQDSILEQANTAELVADYMEWAGQVSGADRLVGQPGNMINFIRKNQPTFTITSQLSKSPGPLQHNCNPGGPAHRTRQNVVLGWHIFRNLAQKNKHGSSKHVKF